VVERVESLVRRTLRRLASMGLRKYNDIAVAISEWRIPRRREGVGEIEHALSSLHMPFEELVDLYGEVCCAKKACRLGDHSPIKWQTD